MKTVYEVLRRIEAFLLAGAILTMALATVANVFARNLFGEPLAETEELNRFLIVLICFVGLSYAAGEGRHIRMTALSDALPSEARRWLMVVVCGTTAALLFLLTWYAANYVLDVDRRSPVLGVPLRVVYVVAPLGLFLSGVQYTLTALRNVKGPGVYITFERLDDYEEVEERDEPRSEA